MVISYKIKFIDSARFMASSLSNLVGNLAKVIHNIKCKDCDFFLEYETVKDYSNKIHEELGTHLSFLIMISINLFCY